MPFQKYTFSLLPKTHRPIRVHTTAHKYDLYVFSFWSTIKTIGKSMRFRWKRSAC